ncbi:MAG: hypothetical protein IT199_07850 [Solirubrobacterales bacterium]|nr:hypothetical protein [Solirubrobacterales bacterium]
MSATRYAYRRDDERPVDLAPDPALRQSVVELADLLGDLAAWCQSLTAHPAVMALLAGEAVPDEVLRRCRLELLALHVGAARVRERLA